MLDLSTYVWDFCVFVLDDDVDDDEDDAVDDDDAEVESRSNLRWELALKNVCWYDARKGKWRCEDDR